MDLTRYVLALLAVLISSPYNATSFKFVPASKWGQSSSSSACLYKTGSTEGLNIAGTTATRSIKMLLSGCKEINMQCRYNLQMFTDRRSVDRRVRIPSLGMASDDEEEEDDDYDDEEISIEEAFDELSNGKKVATYDAIAQWDVVAELLQEKIISTKDFQSMFVKAGGKETKGQLSINIDGFERLLDLLEPYADDISYDDDDDDNDEASAHNISDEEEDDEDGELMEDVFRRLSIGKETILYKNLLTWDVVHDLLNEGSVDDKSLKQYFADCGGTSSGINYENFEKLVDILIDLYGESEEGGDEDITGSNMIEISDGDDGDDDESYVDVETDVVFKQLAKGKEFMTIKDFKKWDLIKSMMESGQLDESELADIVEVSGVDKNKVDIIGFEAILDELSFRAESEEEGSDVDDEK